MSDQPVRRSRDSRALAGFLLAVMGTGLLVAIAKIALMIGDYPGGAYELFRTLLEVFFVSALVVAAAGIAIALPVTWVLSRSALERFWVYPVIGFLAGMMIALILAWMIVPLAPTTI